MLRVRLIKALLVAATIGGCSASETAKSDSPALQDGCTRQAVDQYIRLLFPDPTEDKVVSFADHVDAVKIDLTENQLGIGVLRTASDLDLVFPTLFHVRNDGVPGINPKILVFSSDEAGDLSRANVRYRKIYKDLLGTDQKNLRFVKSKYCDLYASHRNGVIERAVLIMRQNPKVEGAFDANSTREERKKVYDQYRLPVEVCAVKATIALNGAWGVFDYPDSSFSYSLPAIIISPFSGCFNRINTSSIRPGMSQSQVRQRLQGQ